MSDSNLPPEHWRPLFDSIGVEFGYRPLANKIGMEHTKLRRLLLGGGTSVATVREVADAFGVSPETIRELRGERGQVSEPFILPDDAGRLTHDERKVVRAVVRALLDAREHHEREAEPDHPPAEAAGAQGAEKQKTKPAGLSGQDQASNVKPLRRRGRDFTADPVIEPGVAAYDPDEPAGDERRGGEDERGE